MLLILKSTSDEELISPIAKKVIAIANKTNISIFCETVCTDDDDEEEFKKLSHLTKSLVLLVYLNSYNTNTTGESNDENNNIDDDEQPICITTSRAMLRMIATINDDTSITARHSSSSNNNRLYLLGKSIVEDAIIDGWLSFIWISIELPLQALLSSSSSSSSSSKSTSSTVIEKQDIEKKLEFALKTIERHLLKNNSNKSHSNNHENDLYMVGIEGYTLADYSLAISLYYMVTNNIAISSIMTSGENPQLCLWYQTIRPAIIDYI
ncbi:MAG: hypothetical protein ACI90V_004875 [Bacillariaceae sp.]|jgi:hypothetical protein